LGFRPPQLLPLFGAAEGEDGGGKDVSGARAAYHKKVQRKKVESVNFSKSG